MFKKLLVVVAGTGLILSAFAQEQNEKRKIGGSGCFEIGITGMNLRPVEKLVKNDLDKKGFDFSNNVFFTVGGVGYSGLQRNGLRIGMGGWAGYNSKYSDEWQGVADSSYYSRTGDSLIDSVIHLHTFFAHAGMIVERSFELSRTLNAYAGGMIGGGLLAVIADRRASEGAFRNVDSDNFDCDDYDCDDFEAEVEGTSMAFAPMWAFDLHGGLTYTLTSWMHLGLDASAVIYYSTSGFGYKYGNFATVNPGIRLRVVFGNVV